MLEYYQQYESNVILNFKEHIILSATAIGISFAIAFVVGIYSAKKVGNSEKLINFFSFLRLIPSVALLVLAMPILGTGFVPSVTALSVLAAPAIIINTYTGIVNVSTAAKDSAKSMGLTDWQTLWHIELPLAMPLIVSGLRTASVEIIASATIAALMGSGGLGNLITYGLLVNNYYSIFIGGLLVSGIALFVEISLSIVQKVLTLYAVGGLHS